jgi:hypothetical protein
VLHRPHKEGLGPAYLAGFRRALELGAELVVEIDCDFSHDPADVPRLLDAAADADLVLGSRYVPGGSVADWGAVRRAISSGGSLYARLLLGVPIRDLTGGFKCFRRKVLETIDLDAIHSRGYAVPDRADVSRAAPRLPRAARFPIRFVDREIGRLEDVALDRARGDLEGAAAPPRCAGRQAVREVTDASFEEEVLRRGGATIVDFWAPWCKPCKAIEPILEALAADHGLGLVRLDIDEHIGVPSRYGVLVPADRDPVRGRRSPGDRRRRSPAEPLRACLRRVARRAALYSVACANIQRWPSTSAARYWRWPMRGYPIAG